MGPVGKMLYFGKSDDGWVVGKPVTILVEPFISTRADGVETTMNGRTL